MNVQDLVEFWYKHGCPCCGVINWTYHSHSHSQRHYTGLYLNTDACKCYKCGKVYWLMANGECDPTIQDGNPSSCFG